MTDQSLPEVYRALLRLTVEAVSIELGPKWYSLPAEDKVAKVSERLDMNDDMMLTPRLAELHDQWRLLED